MSSQDLAQAGENNPAVSFFPRLVGGWDIYLFSSAVTINCKILPNCKAYCTLLKL